VHFGDGQGQFGKCPKKLENRLPAIARGFKSHALRQKIVPLDFTMEIYRNNQVYVLKIAEDRKNSRNFFLFML